MNVTPSSLPRLRQCLGGACLPSATEASTSGARGTALHAYLEALTNGTQRDEALAAVPAEWRADAEAIDLDALPPLASASAEVALAWNVATDECRVLGVGFTRAQAKAACRPGEMPMLLDRVGATSPTSGVVLDFKSGQQSNLEPAAEHWQVLTYMAAALLAYGWDEVVGGTCRVDATPPRWDTVRMDWLGAQAHLVAVRGLLARAESARVAYAERGEMPPLRLGTWCEWCPASRQCPARVGAALAVLSGEAEAALANRAELTTEAAGALWWRLKNHAMPVLERMLRDLEVIAKANPLPLPDGTVLREVPESKECVTASTAGAWLSKNVGPEVAAAAVVSEPSASWASVERAVKAHHLPRLIAEWEAGGKRGRKPSLAGTMKVLRGAMLAANVARRFEYTAVRAVRELAPDAKALHNGGEEANE